MMDPDLFFCFVSFCPYNWSGARRVGRWRGPASGSYPGRWERPEVSRSDEGWAIAYTVAYV